MIVSAYHNVTTDHAGRPLGMLDGYDPEHWFTRVAELDLPAPAPVAAASDLYYAERTFFLLNVGDDPEFGEPDPQAVAYRARRNRSLSVGDVVRVDQRWYAVANFGFDPIEPPIHVENRAVPGTTPLEQVA